MREFLDNFVKFLLKVSNMFTEEQFLDEIKKEQDIVSTSSES